MPQIKAQSKRFQVRNYPEIRHCVSFKFERSPLPLRRLLWHTLDMPKGPRGEKRPADTHAAAIMVAKLATGELVESLPQISARAAGGRKGGAARAAKLNAEQRREIARKAASARWAKR